MVNTNNLEGINTDKFLNAIHGNESSYSNDLTIKNPESSATGPFQIIEGTRNDIYNKYYKNSMTKSEFDYNYLNDFQFAKTVASKYLEINQPLVEDLQKKYNIPPEYSHSILYFLGSGDGPKYIEDYITTGSHEIAQQKLDNRIRARNNGNLPKNQKVRDYVNIKMNNYYGK